jgi:ABC transporter substrate binding protein
MRRRDFIGAVGGAGVAWPLVARAQQSGKTYRMAVVDPSRPVSVWSETGGVPPREAFFKELRALGYEPDRNLHVKRYSGGGNASRFAELAREVVGSNPDVIVTVSTRMALHFKEATSVIPIVAVTVDPIIAGLVPSLAQRGGNITGVSIEAGSMAPKLVEIVTEAFPGGANSRNSGVPGRSSSAERQLLPVPA